MVDTEGVGRVSISTAIVAWSIACGPHGQTETKKKGKIIIYSFPTSVAPGSNPDRLTGRGREDSQLTPHLATGLFNSDPKCA